MCVCAGPATLTDTIVYVGRTDHPAHGYVEVLGYQNTAASAAAGPNAMLLHLPSGGRMSAANFIRVGAGEDPLADMAAVIPARWASAAAWMDGTMGGDGRVQVFEHDVYTVVLSEDATRIPDALGMVPARRRPRVSAELTAFYGTAFPGWTIALCCFDNADARRARPLMLWYEPFEPELLRLPGLDCHTGGVPVPGERVDREHLLILGADDAPPDAAVRVRYRPRMRHDLRRFLPDRVTGVWVVDEAHTPDLFANGDFVLPLADLNAGRAASALRIG